MSDVTKAMVERIKRTEDVPPERKDLHEAICSLADQLDAELGDGAEQGIRALLGVRRAAVGLPVYQPGEEAQGSAPAAHEPPQQQKAPEPPKPASEPPPRSGAHHAPAKGKK